MVFSESKCFSSRVAMGFAFLLFGRPVGKHVPILTSGRKGSRGTPPPKLISMSSCEHLEKTSKNTLLKIRLE